MEFCPHCMRPASGQICASCGGQMNCAAAPGQLSVGTLLRGTGEHTYQIGAARGQGGFGITYAAMDLSSGQRVAVKEYFPTRCAQRGQLGQVVPLNGQEENYRGGMKSFVEEAMMLSAVGALPSVVTVHDCFEGNGTAYIVMEFVDGMPLHRIVGQKGKLAAKELLPMLPDLLKDFAILHKAGVIHRDISPDNLILMPNGKLKILDFGSARSLQDGKSMSVLLKPGFSPVEQYMSRGQGPYTDVYALAGTLYYCLTGVIPPSSVERLEGDALQRPNALGAGLTAEQEEAILSGLVVQPKSRPANMEVFRERLFPADSAPKQAASAPGGAVSGNPVADVGAKWKKLGDQVKHAIPTKKEGFPGTGCPFPDGQGTAAQTETTAEQSHEKLAEKVSTLKNGISKIKSRLTGRKKGTLALIALAVVAALAATGFGIHYAMTHGTTDDGFVYVLSGDYADIVDYKGEGGAITIPAEIRNRSVAYIASAAFSYEDGITCVSVKGSPYPGVAAFENCSEIRTFVFEDDDADVTDWASSFEDCTALECILLPTEAARSKFESSKQYQKLSGVALYSIGQDTGYGAVRLFHVDSSVSYAVTDRQFAMVLAMDETVYIDGLLESLAGYRVIRPDGRVPGYEHLRYGETEDGYLYQIDEAEGFCTIVQYLGQESLVLLSEQMEDYPVKKVGYGAFAENGSIESVYLPDTVEEVMSRAFAGCGNLTDFGLFSEVRLAEDAFAGCGALRCAVIPAGSSINTNLFPQDFQVYEFGMETGVGTLNFVGVDVDGTIYGVTDDERALVLDFSNSASEVTVRDAIYEIPVVRIYKNAVSGMNGSAVINLPDQVLIDASDCNAVQWRVENINSSAWAWIWSNKLCARLNNILGAGAVSVDYSLLQAMQTRAKELSQSDSHTRPNGTKWSTAMDERKVDWEFAYVSKRSFEGKKWNVPDDYMTDLVEMYSVPEEEENNRCYSRVAVSAYYDSGKNTSYFSCCAIIQ